MKIVTLLILTCQLSAHSWAGPEVKQLLAGYAKIETASCRLRRTVDGGISKTRFISRIYYTNKDQLHVDNLSPLKRRTIADGITLSQYGEGDPKGFSRPIKDLSEQMKISLRKIPGTATDHLMRLRDFPETILATENGIKRIGIATDKTYAILSINAQNQLIAITYYKTPAMKVETASYKYSAFKELIPGVWVPFQHNASLTRQGEKISESIRVDSLTLNQPVAQSLFIASNFFSKDIDFVDDFSKIFTK